MNRGRIITRTLASTMLGIVAVTIVTIPYAILTGLVYFELLPREGPIVMEERPIGNHLFIADNKLDQQLDIYVLKSLKNNKKIRLIAKGELEKKQFYKRDRKKLKEVRFHDFQKNDPVLSNFKDQNLKEPYVPQANCSSDDIREIIDIRID